MEKSLIFWWFGSGSRIEVEFLFVSLWIFFYPFVSLDHRGFLVVMSETKIELFLDFLEPINAFVVWVLLSVVLYYIVECWFGFSLIWF